MRQFRPLLVVAIIGALVGSMVPNEPAAQQDPGRSGLASLEHDLEITQPGAGTTERLGLGEALLRLNIPSVSITLIEGDKLIGADAYGNASARTLYQAASLSKLVTAVAALRLVQQGRLDLDRDVKFELISWQVPESNLTRGHPVTLRGLLSMTGGIGVPGYFGYEPGSPLPNLVQILDGVPPANSPPVRVEYVPGTQYAYSGGGYEIVQALIEDVTHRPFAAAMQDLVLRPLGMSDSVFAQPPPPALLGRVATGHKASGANCRAAGAWCRSWPRVACGPRPRTWPSSWSRSRGRTGVRTPGCSTRRQRQRCSRSRTVARTGSARPSVEWVATSSS